jgi:hypothetical protein
MKQSKLITLLQKLSSGEMARLELFLQSPFFNQSEKVLRFFLALKEYHPGFPEEKISKRSFLEAHFPGEITENKLPPLMTKLLRLSERFLSIEQWEKDEIEQAYHLLEAYEKLELPLHYKAIKRKTSQLLQNRKARDTTYFYQNLRNRLQDLYHAGSAVRDFRPDLQQTMDALDIYFLSMKMFLASEMKDAEHTLSIQYNKRFPSGILEWFDSAPFHSIPLLRAHRLFRAFLEKETTATYQELRQLLLEKEAQFSSTDLYYFYVGMLNYQARKINRTASAEAYEEYLSINEFMLEKGWLFQKGMLSPWIYKNLVTVALKVGKSEWAETFMEKYRSFLPKEYEHDIYHYAKADYLFHQGKPESAQQGLLRLSPRDVILNINVRSLLIRIYFETGQDELLFSFLEATRVYLIRNKLLDEDRRKQMLRFVELTAKIARIPVFEKEKYQRLLQQIPAPKEVMHQKWLLSQLNQRLKNDRNAGPG